MDIKGILGLSRIAQGYGVKLSSGERSRKKGVDAVSSRVTLEEILSARLKRSVGADGENESQLIGAFVEAVLVWEFGTSVEMDVSYAQLRDRLAQDVQNSVALKEHVLKLIGSMQ